MKKKPITVYWAPDYPTEDIEEDWTLLYPKPTSLFNQLVKKKFTDTFNFNFVSSASFFSCPAINSKFKNTYVFSNEIDCSYEFDFELSKPFIKPLTKNALSYSTQHSPSIKDGPLINFSISYILFADQPLEMFCSAPYFHKAGYTKYGSIIPGKYDIGQWFRPYFFEVQMWNKKGEFHLESGEPLFYCSFDTDQEIVFKRFRLDSTLRGYSSGLISGNGLFGRGQTLLSRYSRFGRVGMREKVLTEIQKNLINDNL